MFYDIFTELCARKGVSPTRAAEDMGIARNLPTKWKNTGATPRMSTLYRVAVYFDVPVTDLLSSDNYENAKTAVDVLRNELDYVNMALEEQDEEQKNKATPEDDLKEELEILRESPETRALLHATKGMKPEQIRQMADFIKGFRNNDN